MTEPAFTLRIHLRGGQTLTLECESWELIPDTTTDDGLFVAGGFSYTPHDWSRTIGQINISDISAIEQQVRSDVADAMRADYELRVAEEAAAAEETTAPALLGEVWSR